MLVRTWTATDVCGNSSELIQLVVLRKACVQSAGYWAGRPEEWLTPFEAVTEFELACEGDLTSAANALLILNGCVGKKSDATVGLAQALSGYNAGTCCAPKRPEVSGSGASFDCPSGSGKGNNGVGNGEDPQPSGNPPVNDGPGTGPGNPGNGG